jgi:hypothetical protein
MIPSAKMGENEMIPNIGPGIKIALSAMIAVEGGIQTAIPAKVSRLATVSALILKASTKEIIANKIAKRVDPLTARLPA